MIERYAHIIRQMLATSSGSAPVTGTPVRAMDRLLVELDNASRHMTADRTAELTQSVGKAKQWVDFLPAAAGEAINTAAWGALILTRLSHSDDVLHLHGGLFHHFARFQRPSGALFQTTSSDSPETHWYHELVLLHALTSFAVRTSDDVLLRASARAAAFHLNETQPDHATSQPWALNAFILHVPANSLADGMLNAVQVYQSAAMDRATLLLLADSLYCIETATTNRGKNTQE